MEWSIHSCFTKKKGLIIACSSIVLLLGTSGALIANSDFLFNESLRMPLDPFISGDSFRYIADHVMDYTSNHSLDVEKIKKGDVIFVNGDFLLEFFMKYHRAIKSSYILVSNNSDFDPTYEFLDYLNDDKLLVWFAQNAGYIAHDKLIPIPLGIVNRYSGIDRVKIFIELSIKSQTTKNFYFM